jgi:acetyl esterase/lipase
VARGDIVRLVLVLLLAGIAWGQTANQQYKVVADVKYCNGGGKPLLMDIFIPVSRSKTTPAVLWLHGGGWERGDKNGNSGALMLADAGFVTASIFYRLSGDSPFPADIQDCKCAIRYLRANARTYGIDPNRIGVAGASAGGHLAELVATANDKAGLEGDGGWESVSSRVRAASAYYGASDFTVGALEFQHHTGKVIVKLFGGNEKEKPDLYKQGSPINHVSRDDPPLLLVHGEQGTTWFHSSSRWKWQRHMSAPDSRWNSCRSRTRGMTSNR